MNELKHCHDAMITSELQIKSEVESLFPQFKGEINTWNIDNKKILNWVSCIF